MSDLSRTLPYVRRWAIAACIAALFLLVWRAASLAEEFAREREAARAYQQGTALLASGRSPEAVLAFRRVLTLAPRAVEAYGALAEAEFRQRHIDQAIAAYRQWLAIYPYTYVAELYREVGTIELRAGRPAAARADLERAAALNSRDWMAFHLLAHAYRDLGNFGAARAAWQQVVRLNPQFAPAHDQLRRLGN